MKEKKFYGKEKCRILKQIRAEIAKQNDIAWVVEECSHKGNCRGTCPKCEAEVRQLERALERRAALGKTVAVVGISAGLSLSITGCANPLENLGGKPLPDEGNTPANGNANSHTSAVEETERLVFDGVEIPETDTVAITEEALMGEPEIEPPVPGEEPETEDEILQGAVPEEYETVDVVIPMGDAVEFPEDVLGGEPLPEDYMDGVLVITVAETLPSCVAVEENCFYGTDKDGYFWRIYCDDTSAIEEGKIYEVEIGDIISLTYPDGYPDGGWTPQYETTAKKIQ